MPEAVKNCDEEVTHTMPARDDDDLMSEWSAHSTARSHTPSGVVSDDEDDARTVELQLTYDAPLDTLARWHPDRPFGPVAGPSRRHLVTDDSDDPMDRPLPGRGRAIRSLERFDDWYTRLRSSGHLGSLSQPPPPPSIAPSATSITTVSTVSTVRDHSNSPIKDGNWMSQSR
ncbi:hypothetical protein GY45DRAFT_1315802, partial [Cubamyces sp. BRFM 1775]